MQAASHFFLIEVRHHALVTLWRAFIVAGHGLVLEVAVKHDLVIFFVAVEPVQYKCGCSLKPTNVFGLAAPRNDGKSRGRVFVKTHHMLALRQHVGVPIQREVVQDGVVFCVGHVVR